MSEMRDIITITLPPGDIVGENMTITQWDPENGWRHWSGKRSDMPDFNAVTV